MPHSGANPGSIGFGTTKPTSGYYVRGSIVLNSNAAAGQLIGWQCVVTGFPGSWEILGITGHPLAPIVTSADQDVGDPTAPHAGLMTITGTGFVNGATVRIGGHVRYLSYRRE
jgi:hypothetical protein